ncbi:MAG: hypothetical protein ACOYEA_00420 [Fermentimonas sp.]|jgi:hypothetical protein
MKRLPLILLLIINTSILIAQKSESFTYKIDGTLKNKYEYSTDTKTSRFTVRNSRIGVTGDVNKFTSYRTQVELSDEGQFKVLDLSATLHPIEGLDITLGQTAIPLFNSYVVSPAKMIFANRTFLAKYYLSTRDIGINAKYSALLGVVPVKLEIGVYNGNAINDPVWKDRLSFGSRLEIGNMEGLRFTAKFYDYQNEPIANNMFYGADLRYEKGPLIIESEIMKKDDRTDINKDLISGYLQSSYKIPIKKEMFNYILPAIRWDAIDEYNDDTLDVSRLTLGFGLGNMGERFSTIIRFDYEWYFVNNELSIFNKNEQMDSDKFTMELLITF